MLSDLFTIVLFILLTIVLIYLIITTRQLERRVIYLPKYIKMMFPTEVENLYAFLHENKSYDIKICKVNGLPLAALHVPFSSGYLTIKDNSIIVTWVSPKNHRQIEISDFSLIELIAKHGTTPNLLKIGDKERNCEIIVSDDVF